MRRGSLFDLRWIIALLFGIYGAVLVVLGIWFTDGPDLAKAGGLNVNLWAGVGMLLLAAFFAGWALVRPVRVPPE